MCAILQGFNCLHTAICEGDSGIVSELLAGGACELTRVEVSDRELHNVSETCLTTCLCACVQSTFNFV